MQTTVTGQPAAEATSPTRRRTDRRLPTVHRTRLHAALRREHGIEPFSTADVRGSAHRALAIAEQLGLPGHLERGGLDLGYVEVEHLWVVVAGRPLDVAMPLFADRFRSALRDWVAGDVSGVELAAIAAHFGLEWRVVGDAPTTCRYVGTPVLAHRWATRGTAPGA